MTQKESHPLSDIIRAYIDGQQIQTRQKNTQDVWTDCFTLEEIWTDCFTLEEMNRAGLSFPDFNHQNREWRIKPKTKTFLCRMGLFRDPTGRHYVYGYDNVVNRGIDDWFIRGEDPRGMTFVRWLTDMIQFEIDEE